MCNNVVENQPAVTDLQSTIRSCWCCTCDRCTVVQSTLVLWVQQKSQQFEEIAAVSATTVSKPFITCDCTCVILFKCHLCLRVSV